MSLNHHNYIIINYSKEFIKRCHITIIAIIRINMRCVPLGLAFVVVVACEGFVGKSYCSGYIA